jgi:dipeptidyl aminopeptidase/acylaminoacyl peptidase
MISKHPAQLFLLLACLLPALSFGSPSGKRPITHEDVWLMKRIGSPKPSPDGRWVVFQVAEPSYEDKSQSTDLWIVAADGSSEPRRLTATLEDEKDVAWSPDSRRIAFSARANKDAASQIHVLTVGDGSLPVPVTSLTLGARNPQFSPDGSRLLFVSRVYRGAGSEEDNRRIAEERKARKYNARVYDGFPIRHWDRWLDDRRPSLFVLALEGTDAASGPRDLLAGSGLVRQPGFGARYDDDSGDEVLDADWTPDSRAIVFAATTNRDAAARSFTNTDLFQVNLSGGEPIRLTPVAGTPEEDRRDSWERPRFGPDGRLYALHRERTDYVYNLARVAQLDWPIRKPARILTADLDRAVSSFTVTRDGQLYLLAEDAGHEKLYAVATKGGKTRLVIDLPRGAYTQLASPERARKSSLFARWESAVNPPEIVRIDLQRGTHVALTRFNAARASEIDWQPPQEFWFTSSRGRRIHNFLVLPPDFDPARKYPVIALLHGGPHSMWRDQFVVRWNYHLVAQPGYVLVQTNYTGSTGFGEQFSRNIQGDPLRTPGEEINEAVDEAIHRFPFIDGNLQCAAGASYGGHLANWLAATTTRYRCLVNHAGLMNLESQWATSDTIFGREINNGGPVWENGEIWRTQNPIRRAADIRTPMLVTIGERDFRVPLNNALETWSVLQRLQVPSRLVVFPDENHWILKGENSRFFYQQVHAWFTRWLIPSERAASRS